ncbi:MAG: hypothetical protein KDC38_14545 [Planctomycetes bacterium]|nr:hypothetical protein [Planctomycetota bacterium]
MSMQLRRRSEEGMVLLLALVVMTALVAVGLVYAEHGMANGEQSTATFDRLELQAASEAGVEYGLYRLFQVGSSDGQLGPVAVGPSQVTIEWTSAGSDLDIVSRATTGDITLGALSRVSIVTGEHVLDGALYASGDVGFPATTFAWNDAFRYGGTLTTHASTLTGAMSKIDRIPSFALDLSGYAVGATQSLVDGDTVSNLDCTGFVYGVGAIELRGRLSVSQMVVVDGDLVLHGLADEGLIGGRNGLAILVHGTLTIRNFDRFVAKGHILATGDIQIHQVNDLQLDGCLGTNGSIEIDTTTGSLAYEDSDADAIPAGWSGGARIASAAELWRIPFTGSTAPKLADGASSPAPPADDELTTNGGDGGILDLSGALNGGLDVGGL